MDKFLKEIKMKRNPLLVWPRGHVLWGQISHKKFSNLIHLLKN
jgi:hypothetical protein